MQLKNGEIFEMTQHLGALSLDVPARVGYHLGRLVKKIKSAGVDIEASRNQLIAKYGVAGEGGQTQIKPDSPNWATFVVEYNGLMNEQTDIDANKVILPAETKISVETLMLFDCFLEVEGCS